MALMAAYVLRKNKPISYRTYLIMVMVSVAAIATSLIPVWLFLFKFSLPQVAGLWLWAVAEGVPGSILGFLFVRSVAKSGVLSA